MGQLIPVPGGEPGPAERPEFFEQILGDEADAAARKAAKKPWWLPANRAGYYFKIGGLYFTLAVAALIASFAGAPVAYARMFACLWVLMSLSFLVPGVVVRRRTRRARETTRDLESPPGRGER